MNAFLNKKLFYRLNISSPIEHYVYNVNNLHNLYRTYVSYGTRSSLSYRGLNNKLSDELEDLVNNILMIGDSNSTNIKDIYELIKKIRLSSVYKQEDIYEPSSDISRGFVDDVIYANTQKSLYELGLGYVDKVRDFFEENEAAQDLYNIALVFDYISTLTSTILSVYASGPIVYVLSVPDTILDEKELESVLKIKKYEENGQTKIELGHYLKSILDISLRRAYENAGNNENKKRYVEYSNATIKYLYENNIIDDSDYLYCIYNLTSLKAKKYEINRSHVYMYINIIANTLYPEDYIVMLETKLGLNIKFGNIKNDVDMKSRYLIGFSGKNAFYLKTVLIYNFHNVVLDERNSKPGHKIEIKENMSVKESFKNHFNITPLIYAIKKISLYKENQAHIYT
ncbi:MAG: hypothetical protein QXF12_02510 [Candidatus Aenigmatarchaeota archaeon]